MPDHRGEYATVTARPWESMSLADKIALLQGACATLKIDGRIVDWEAHLHHRRSQTLLVNASGAHMAQRFDYVSPGLLAVANEGAQTQRRTGGGAGSGRQGGWNNCPCWASRIRPGGLRKRRWPCWTPRNARAASRTCC